jgi:hypothetical protein
MILLYMLVRRAEHQKQLQKNGKDVALAVKPPTKWQVYE